MSMVGPRPHAIEHNFDYDQRISDYMTRHRIKPGITGLAQVNGYRGETDTLDKMKKRVEYDMQYINNWSFWLDLKILLKTIPALLRDDVLRSMTDDPAILCWVYVKKKGLYHAAQFFAPAISPDPKRLF